MRDTIKGEYVRQYLLGRGGRDQMTAAEYGRIGGLLAHQYSEYLDEFARKIEAGELSEAQIARYAEQYLEVARIAAEYGKVETQAEDAKEIKWNLTAAENCPGCQDFARMGWQPVGDDPYHGCVPLSGCTPCGPG